MADKASVDILKLTFDVDHEERNIEMCHLTITSPDGKTTKTLDFEDAMDAMQNATMILLAMAQHIVESTTPDPDDEEEEKKVDKKILYTGPAGNA